MEQSERYIVVDSEVLPEVFLKVLEAKSLLAKGTAKTSSEACKMVGISRGAYYKYKDKMFGYSERFGSDNITLHFVLEDTPGILSAVLTRLYELGANILTVNQNIPNDAVAVVSVLVRMPSGEKSQTHLLNLLKQVQGVVDVKIL